MTRKLLTLVLFLSAALVAPVASAANVSEVYRDALAFDAQYASAKAAYQAAEEKIPQARAGLLPNVSATASLTHAQAQTTFPSNFSFNSTSWGVSATQPIFRKQNWVVADEADAQVKAAQAELQTASQDLLLRTANAYFGVLQAQDNVEFVRAQQAAISEQLASAKRNFEVGTATITDTNEAQARFDLAAAQEIAAFNALEVSKRALFKLTGVNYERLSPLASGAIQKPADLGSLENWMGRAGDGNLTIIAQRYLKAAADSEVERNRAGHYPTLDLVASYNDSGNQSFGFLLLDVKSTAIGLQLGIPIYQGGLVSSGVRQAIANQEKARQDLANAQRDASLQTSQAYLNVINGAAQVKALEQALVSSQTSLDSTRLGMEVGVRTNIDVLNAQQQVYSTKKDLAAARYNYLLDTLSLKAAVGALSDPDLADLDHYLVN
jgi:outer membrane protein